jgi:hypothetical protein
MAPYGSTSAESNEDRFETRILLEFEPSKDVELTCIVCGGQGVDLEATVRDRRNSRITIGKHSACVWKPISRTGA